MTPDREHAPVLLDGWYRLCDRAELRPDRIRVELAFGRDLIAYRSGSGAAVVQDAYCPHLGAHIGYGGEIETEGVRCPFHGWLFDDQGLCRSVPYVESAPRVRLRTLQTHESGPFVFVWFSIGNRPAWFSPPELEELFPGRIEETLTWDIATQSREVIENIVDRTHFVLVHDLDELPTVEVSAHGPLLEVRRTQSYIAPEGLGTLHYETTCVGPGVVISTVDGPIRNSTIVTVTPLDSEHIRLTLRVSTAMWPVGEATRVMEEVVASSRLQIGRDIPIWEHKTYVVRPPLLSEDGPIAAVRTWLQQFDVSRSAHQGIE